MQSTSPRAPRPSDAPSYVSHDGGDWRFRADGGEEVVLHDVVGGAWPELLPFLEDIHLRYFEEYEYAIGELSRDALLPSQRIGISVHQWAVTVDGEPVGYVCGEINTVRRVSPMTFLAVDPEHRSLRLDGQKIGPWLLCQGIRQFHAETGQSGFGLGGESDTVDYLVRSGWRILPCEYREPVHGDAWAERGMETRPMQSVWLPDPTIPVAEHENVEPSAQRAIAAAFLLDIYGLPVELPWVRSLVGEEEAARPGPRRHEFAR